MHFRTTRSAAVLLSAFSGLASALPPALAGGPLTPWAVPTPGPGPAPASYCYSFSTIAQGQYSGFGYYCGAPLNSPPADPSTDTAPPCYAAVANPELQAIIRGECAWIDFWNTHSQNVFPPPPVPYVDFDRFAVIAVISGPRSSGCYDIEITQIVAGRCGATVHCRERVPCPDGELCTDAITNSFHFVKVCKQFVPFERPVCFENRNFRVPCSLSVACADTGPDPSNP